MSVTEENAAGPRTVRTGLAGHLSGRRPARSRLPGAISALLAFFGLTCGVLALLPAPDPGSVDEPSWIELALLSVGVFPNLGFATLLLIVSAAVGARKRVAWWAMFAYQGLLAVDEVSFLLGSPPEETFGIEGPAPQLAVRVIILVVLLAAYPEFYARVRRAVLTAAVATLVGALAAGVLVGWGLVELFPGTVPVGERLSFALGEVAGLGVSLTEAASEPGRPPEWLVTLLGFFAGAAIVAAAVVLFRSRRSRNALSPADEAALRALVERHGSADSLSYFALRRDKSAVFGPDGRAAVAYRVEAGVCIAAGDPLGDPRSWAGAISTWLDSAAGYGWMPAVVAASREGATAYHKAGLSVLHLGDEAVVTPASFSLRGSDMAPVRQAVNRATKAGVSVRIRRHADVPEEELARAGELAYAWRGAEMERGFSMALGR